MANPLVTYDNNVINPLRVADESQFRDLEKIAGKKISWLCKDGEEDNLLVFPRHLNEYGDKIGDNAIFNINGNTLFTGNIMGFVGIGDTMLKIGSRFDDGRADLFMHYMLERVFSVNMFDLQYSFNYEDIFDFLLFLFPFYLKNALAQGVYKEYKTFDRNDANLRGILDVNRHIRINIPATGSIAYKSREHTYDNNITELVRHTIEFIRTKEFGETILHCDEMTRTYVSQIMESTPSYNRNERQKVVNSCLRPRIHPYYSEYDPLRKICLQILRHDEIKYGEDKDTVYGILFDGAWLWEEYLWTVLEPLNISHPRNKTSEGAIYLFENQSAVRYPDFMGTGIILDAKYKRYAGCKVSEIDREDLSQIISYMYVEKAHHGVVLCPGGSKIQTRSSTLRGYGGTMSIVELPISSKSEYKSFNSEMLDNEKTFSSAIAGMIAPNTI